MESLPPDFKRCVGNGSCGEVKPLESFYVKRPATGERQSLCKDCANKRTMERYRATHPAAAPKSPPAEKRCTVCGEVKPFDQFGWKDKKAGRRREMCQPCHNAETRAYKSSNRESIRAKDAVYRERVANDLLADRQRTWRITNPERASEIAAKSKTKHADRRRVDVQRRRDNLRGRGGKISAAELRALFARYGWLCVRCGEAKPIAFDHVDPEGPGTVANGQPLCTSCNSWKLTRKGDEYDFRNGSVYDLRPELPVGTVDLAMADLPMPAWVYQPRRELVVEEKLCLGPTHSPNGEMLPVDAFPIRSMKSGKPHRKTYCYDCLPVIQRMARAAKKPDQP